jgi:IS4 transposase
VKPSKRDCRIFGDFAQVLIAKARRLYAADEFAVQLEQTAYVLDATTIDLCLSVFPWAQFRKHKSAIKLHTLFDLRGNIPTLVIVTSGRVFDGKMLKHIAIEPGSFYIMDRAYRDLVQLHRIHQQQAFFIIRAIRTQDLRRLYSHPVDKTTGLQCDQTVVFNGPLSGVRFPDKLRRIRYLDPLTQKCLIFLTNNFNAPALTIADLYRCRWQVELFFKWIKQHLRIKAFYGTSENAVKTQVWIAISIYVLVAIIKKELRLEHSLYTILQILSVTLFEKTPILQAFSDPHYTSEYDILENAQKQRRLPGF